MTGRRTGLPQSSMPATRTVVMAPRAEARSFSSRRMVSSVTGIPSDRRGVGVPMTRLASLKSRLQTIGLSQSKRRWFDPWRSRPAPRKRLRRRPTGSIARTVSRPVPVAELSGKRAPVDVVNGKIVRRFEEFSVITSFVAPPRAPRLEYIQDNRPFLIGHSPQHGRPPDADRP